MSRRSASVATCIAAITSTLLAISLSAQAGPVRLGVMAGANVATFAGDDVEDASSKVGLLVGASLVKPLSGALSLQIDALYSMKGAKEKSADGDVTVKLNYVEVPIQLRYDIGTGKAKPFLSAGASLAFKAGCKFEGKESGVSVSFDCSELENAAEIKIKSFDAGAVVGGGVDCAVGKNTLTFGARYTLGLTDIEESSKVRNRALSLYAGISMPMKR